VDYEPWRRLRFRHGTVVASPRAVAPGAGRLETWSCSASRSWSLSPSGSRWVRRCTTIRVPAACRPPSGRCRRSRRRDQV